MANGHGGNAKAKKGKAVKTKIAHISVGREHLPGQLQQKFHASAAVVDWWTALFDSPHGLLEVSQVQRHADAAAVGKQANVRRLNAPETGDMIISVIDRIDGPFFPRYERSLVLLDPQGVKTSKVARRHDLQPQQQPDGALLPVVNVWLGATGVPALHHQPAVAGAARPVGDGAFAPSPPPRNSCG
jgi:hypothetical protein